MTARNEVIAAIKIILSDETRYKTSLNYAVNYCKAALKQEGEDLRVQCVYILNNITHWRHPKASAIRSILKAYVKE
jgi:hypothetical protein